MGSCGFELASVVFTIVTCEVLNFDLFNRASSQVYLGFDITSLPP